ncbi:hypothetical protein PFISCL1PPCAC_18195 [Pristionchus fissidentatus]|uniref:Dehydrogenase n=1 Tax=Pristionchus fissidentatus TaxID=1538716 RepID=A0AAV5W5T2_9BILA|nr:hypothetical protein PFISCL1PPCAC_18195 [Pristionchus fissidentatus]
MNFFSEKVAIVTGSSNGIGRATAALFAKEGAKLTITGRNEETLAETHKLCIDAGAKGEDILQLIGDVRDAAFCEQFVRKTIEKFGQLDVLVNNAGAAVFDFTGKTGIEQPLSNYDTTIDVNVRSIIRICKFAVPHLEKSKGAIVNVSSMGSSPFISPVPYYAMAKAALDQLTVQMAGTLIKRGIRVNSVNPGAVATNFAVTSGATKDMMEQMMDTMADYAKTIPLGRTGLPEDIGKIILFLADRSQSEIIIGQRIVADGGTLLMNSLLSQNI